MFSVVCLLLLEVSIDIANPMVTKVGPVVNINESRNNDQSQIWEGVW